MNRTLDKVGGFSAAFVALWPVVYWILWGLVHIPNGFHGFDGHLETLYYPAQHPLLWKLTTLPNFFLTLAIALMTFVTNEYIRQVQPTWSRLVVWFGSIMVLANLLEAIITSGIMPWLAEHSSLQAPESASAYLAMRAVLWLTIWLSVISTCTVTALFSILLRVTRSAPSWWCYLGLLDAALGFASLEGAKVLRVANSLVGVVWVGWLAVMFFRGTFVQQVRHGLAPGDREVAAGRSRAGVDVSG